MEKMGTPTKRARLLGMHSTSTKSQSQSDLATPSTTNLPSRLARAKYLRLHAIPALQSKKLGLSLLFSDYRRKQEHHLMAGSIASPSTDILSHMDPERVLNGLLDDPDYMVQLERQLQCGDRCLYACVVVKDQIATCQRLLAKRIADYANLVCMLGKETTEALEEEEEILGLLKQGSQDVDKANERLEDATKAEQEEVTKSPWGH